MGEYFKRLGRFWFPDKTAALWFVLALPGLYFFQVTVHEGTHGVMAWRENGDFPTVAPFPHLSITNGKVGGFQNGVTFGGKSVSPLERKTCNPNDPPRTFPPRLAGWIGWPQVVALLLTVIFAAIFLILPITNPLLAFLLRAWYFAACIDFLFNSAKILFGICADTQDWARVMIRGDHGSGWFWLLTFGLWLLVIVGHLVWVYWSRWGKENLEERGYWDYRWIAFILGIMSTLAVIVSLAVGDETRIYKRTIFFIVPLVIQLFISVYYWGYFAKSFSPDKET